MKHTWGDMVIGFGVCLSVFIVMQYISYRNEPKVIEVLPVTNQRLSEVEVRPEWYEVVRVVFDKSVTKEDIDFLINPGALVNDRVKEVQLRSVSMRTGKYYFAYVLESKIGLKPNTQYDIYIYRKKFNIFRMLDKPIRIHIKTMDKDSKTPKERGEVQDMRIKEYQLLGE